MSLIVSMQKADVIVTLCLQRDDGKKTSYLCLHNKQGGRDHRLVNARHVRALFHANI